MRFKKLDEFSSEELVRYQVDGTIPEVNEERDAAMLRAGWSPTGAPIDLEKEKRDKAKREAREAELEEAESKTVADHLEELEVASVSATRFLDADL